MNLLSTFLALFGQQTEYNYALQVYLQKITVQGAAIGGLASFVLVILANTLITLINLIKNPNKQIKPISLSYVVISIILGGLCGMAISYELLIEALKQ